MKRASRHRAGLRCWTKNGEPFLVRVCRRLPPWGHHWPYPNGTTLPVLSDFQLPMPIFEDLRHRSFPLLYRNLRYRPLNWQSAIGNRHFRWWTWHDLNVQPRPSHSRALVPLSYRSRHISNLRFQIEDLRRQSEILNLQSEIFLTEATGVEPAHD